MIQKSDNESNRITRRTLMVTCGAAVAQCESVIVEDVSADPRYLACSLGARSEIVVPIRANGKIVGEIDIDSHTINAFGAEDRIFLENCAAALGKFLER